MASEQSHRSRGPAAGSASSSLAVVRPLGDRILNAYGTSPGLVDLSAAGTAPGGSGQASPGQTLSSEIFSRWVGGPRPTHGTGPALLFRSARIGHSTFARVTGVSRRRAQDVPQAVSVPSPASAHAIGADATSQIDGSDAVSGLIPGALAMPSARGGEVARARRAEPVRTGGAERVVMARRLPVTERVARTVAPMVGGAADVPPGAPRVLRKSAAGRMTSGSSADATLHSASTHTASAADGAVPAGRATSSSRARLAAEAPLVTVTSAPTMASRRAATPLVTRVLARTGSSEFAQSTPSPSEDVTSHVVPSFGEMSTDAADFSAPRVPEVMVHRTAAYPRMSRQEILFTKRVPYSALTHERLPFVRQVMPHPPHAGAVGGVLRRKTPITAATSEHVGVSATPGDVTRGNAIQRTPDAAASVGGRSSTGVPDAVVSGDVPLQHAPDGAAPVGSLVVRSADATAPVASLSRAVASPAWSGQRSSTPLMRQSLPGVAAFIGRMSAEAGVNVDLPARIGTEAWPRAPFLPLSSSRLSRAHVNEGVGRPVVPHAGSRAADGPSLGSNIPSTTQLPIGAGAMAVLRVSRAAPGPAGMVGTGAASPGEPTPFNETAASGRFAAVPGARVPVTTPTTSSALTRSLSGAIIGPASITAPSLSIRRTHSRVDNAGPGFVFATTHATPASEATASRRVVAGQVPGSADSDLPAHASPRTELSTSVSGLWRSFAGSAAALDPTHFLGAAHGPLVTRMSVPGSRGGGLVFRHLQAPTVASSVTSVSPGSGWQMPATGRSASGEFPSTADSGSGGAVPLNDPQRAALPLLARRSIAAGYSDLASSSPARGAEPVSASSPPSSLARAASNTRVLVTPASSLALMAQSIVSRAPMTSSADAVVADTGPSPAQIGNQPVAAAPDASGKAEAAAAPDTEELVDRVCRRVYRELIIEHERRGAGPWN